MPADVPVTVIGVASNLLVRDGGIAGVVIRLGRGFVEIAVQDGAVAAGAGALDLNVALAARRSRRSPGSNSCPAFPARSAAGCA